ncbi:MAG: protein kinase domain-containing protein [Pseudomonadota bacterium]
MESELPPIAVFFDIPRSGQGLARTLCDDLFDAVGWYACDQLEEADFVFSSGAPKGVEGQLLLDWPPVSEQGQYAALSRELTRRLWLGDEAVALIWRRAMQVVGPESSDLEIQSAVSGSRAWVYRARSRSLGCSVVAKAQPQGAELLRREGRVMEMLPPAVAPQFYRCIRWRGQPLLLMEDCGSGHFSRLERIPGQASIPADSLRALLATIEKVHAAGWVHGDIKPEHILFPGPDRAVLIDWGLAEGGGLKSASPAGRWSGTPLYMAPERFSGAPPSVASDLYSLAVVLIESLLGGFPPDWLDLPVSELRTSVLSRWRAGPMVDTPFFDGLLALADMAPGRRTDGFEALKSLCHSASLLADLDI